MNNKSKWIVYLIIVFSILISLLQIGNYKNISTNANNDDWTHTYAYFFSDPLKYENDFLSTFGYQQTFSTIINWLPALLYKYLHISPDYPSFLIILLNYVLSGISLFKLSSVIVKNKYIGWMSACLVFGAGAYSWNLANYGGKLNHPYAAWLAIPFVIFAFKNVITGNNLRVFIFLTVGGLVHPMIILYSIFFLSIYELIVNRKIIPTKFHLLLFSVAIITVFPRLYIQRNFSSGDLLSFVEMRDAFLVNMHVTIKKLTKTQTGFLRLLPLFFISLRDYKDFTKKYQNLWMSIFIGSSFLVFLYWVGWEFEILFLIQLIPHRATFIFSIMSIPIFLNYLSNNFEDYWIFSKILSLIFIILIIWSRFKFLNSRLYFLFLFFFLITDSLVGKLGPLSFNVENLNLLSLSSNVKLNESKRKKYTKIQVTFISLIILIIITFYNSWIMGRNAFSTKLFSKYQLQSWVNENLCEDALIVNIGRTISQRASVNPIPRARYVYNRSREAKEYEDRLKNFYYNYYDDPTLTHDQIKKIVFNEDAIINFCTEFQCDYVVRENSEPLEFNLLYKNATYSLYRIPF